MTKMKAMIVREVGSADSFEFTQVEYPKLRAGHLIVKVRATSVNPIDTKVRGRSLPFSPAFPAVLHVDFSGEVEEVAADVKGFQIGDAVYGAGGGIKGTEGGALAEFLLVDAKLVSLMPTNLSFTQTATLPLVAITAWEALFDKLRIRSGDSILVHAGLGGVGHIAAQLAKYAGAVVHTTVSQDENKALSQEYGADYALNYRTTSVAQYVQSHTAGRGFDFVFDTVGGANLANSFEATRLNGSVACIATGGSHDLSLMYVKGISLHSVIMLIPLMTGLGREHYGNLLFEVKKLVEAGRIKPLLHSEVFDWKDIGHAHALQESGRQRGKIAVEIRP